MAWTRSPKPSLSLPLQLPSGCSPLSWKLRAGACSSVACAHAGSFPVTHSSTCSRNSFVPGLGGRMRKRQESYGNTEQGADAGRGSSDARHTDHPRAPLSQASQPAPPCPICSVRLFYRQDLRLRGSWAGPSTHTTSTTPQRNPRRARGSASLGQGACPTCRDRSGDLPDPQHTHFPRPSQTTPASNPEARTGLPWGKGKGQPRPGYRLQLKPHCRLPATWDFHLPSLIISYFV